ncbi:hypothetical protein M9M90_20700 [Phenylobacterium sp. LH3H17]|uniref:hypothetical protein n=1 Tax=Phenylobacterium sp. LH3H17 TaxID=2903901 RepID=UPI0020C9DCA1|nr:hypothetical protein [Phenylobacterium sp. LH3H17]UTP39591.1 hypothetical protein M9M90_20700 [Phenylobacterium sp. LH3H17]
MNSHAESARLLDILIPNGGDLVTVSEAYFDESYEDRKPRVLCVAGYVFRKSKAVEFGKEWSQYLSRRGLPYFHANECAHTAGIFKGRTDADEVSRHLIALTKEKSDFGVAVAVDQEAYGEVFPDRASTLMPTPYAFALMSCFYHIAHWRSVFTRTSPTAFFFEQGHKHADDAHRYLRFLLKSDDFGPRIGYRAHSFVPKETPQVQPGDLLAWLWRLQASRNMTGDPRPVRADLKALMRPRDKLGFFGRPHLEHFKANVRADWEHTDQATREVARAMGLPEDVVEELAQFRPDYRTSKV